MTSYSGPNSPGPQYHRVWSSDFKDGRAMEIQNSVLMRHDGKYMGLGI